MKKIWFKKKQKGMTLIELVIVLSIFSILTGVVLFNYGDFSSSLTMQNLADDIALTIRRAQSYAIGVRGSSGEFEKGFGVNFSVRDANISNEDFKTYSSSQKSFIFYTEDTSGGRYYFEFEGEDSCGISSDPSYSCLEKLSIKTADYISNIKIKKSDKPENLTEDEQINIFFIRPNPEPKFCLIEKGKIDCDDNSSRIEEVIIEIRNFKSTDINKYVKIFNTGQISVSNDGN